MRAACAARGFTLIEIVVVLALAGLLVGAAWPSYRAELHRTQRADAIEALVKVQLTQERFRAAHGLYAPDLGPLRLSANSPQNRYAIEVRGTGPDGYRASAVARAPAAGDADCATLTLEVRDGFATSGPNARCWNR